MAEKKVKIVAVIDGETGGFTEAIATVEKETQRSAGVMEGIWQGVGQQITRAFVDVGKWAARQLVEGVGWVKDEIVGAVANAAEFESALAQASTKGVQDIEALRQGIVEVANEIGTDLVAQTNAFQEALRRGVGEDNIVEFMTTANKLAETSSIDLGLATEGLMDTINAYGYSTDRAVEIADKLITSQRIGKLEVGELTMALGQLAPMASQVNMSFDELMATMVKGAEAGLKQREVVGGLRGILEGLLKPTEQQIQLYNQMGLSIDDVANKIQSGGLIQLLGELGPDAMEKMAGSASELSLMLAILGQDAGASFQEAMGAIQNSAGAMEAEFAKVENTTMDQWGDLIARIKILGTEALSPLNDLLRQVLERVNANLSEKFPEIGANFKEGLNRWLWGGVSDAQAAEINQMVADGRMSMEEAIAKTYSGGVGDAILKVVDEWTTGAGKRILADLEAVFAGDMSFGDMLIGWMSDGWAVIRPYVIKIGGEMGKFMAKAFAEAFLPAVQDVVGEFLYQQWEEFTAPGAGLTYAKEWKGPRWTEYSEEDRKALGFQGGGIVPGIGSGDIVPAMLEPGEMVIPRGMMGNGNYGKDGSYGGNKTYNVTIRVDGARDPREVAKEIKKILRDEERMGRGYGNWAVEY
jgi:TP901 family phage tail tape measure protein